MKTHTHILALFLLFFAAISSNAQNIGINATGAAPVTSAGLDVDFTNKGILIPRVALTTTTLLAPVVGISTASLLVYNTATAGVSPNNVTPGYYYWNGSKWIAFGGSGGKDWSLTGNAGTSVGSNFIGTTDAVDFSIRTNNIERIRVLSGGNVGIGTATPTRKFHLVGSAASPISLGLVSNSGNGDALVSRSVSLAGYAAFWGNNASSNPGSAYGITTSSSAIQGQVPNAGNYSFAILGVVGGLGNRIGGIYGGGPYTGQWASLGYQTSGGTSWALYYSNDALAGGASTGTGRMSNNTSTISSGMGIGGYADLLGAGIRGGKYGMYIHGNRFGIYTDGKTYTNDIIAQIIDGNNKKKSVAYFSTSTNVDMYTRGTASLVNGRGVVKFDKNYSNLISSKSPVIVTVSPMGKSNGIYIESTNLEGFTVVENNDGKSNITFSWIAIGTRSGYEKTETPSELLSNDFELNMLEVINNENNPKSKNKPMWWDGSKLNFGSLPKNTRTLQTPKISEEIKK